MIGNRITGPVSYWRVAEARYGDENRLASWRRKVVYEMRVATHFRSVATHRRRGGEEAAKAEYRMEYERRVDCSGRRAE